MSIACKICIAKNGLRGSELSSLPQNEEELFEHMEAIHHMPVTREGESKKDSIKRFINKYPEAKNCLKCKEAGAEWTK